MYYTYILRCEDNSLYTGITTDLERRLNEHMTKGEKCTKYTMTHSVTGLEAAWQSSSRSAASKLEYRIKELTKPQKEQLIKSKNLKTVLGDKINAEEYEAVK